MKRSGDVDVDSNTAFTELRNIIKDHCADDNAVKELLDTVAKRNMATYYNMLLPEEKTTVGLFQLLCVIMHAFVHWFIFVY